MNLQEQNKAAVTSWYEELWNNGDDSIIDKMMHPECKAYGLGPEPVIGPEQFKYFYKAFRDLLGDINITIDKNLADGDYVIAQCTVKGTYKATGNPVNFTGTSIAEMQGGKLINGWNHFDFLTMNMQMGKIKPEQLI